MFFIWSYIIEWFKREWVILDFGFVMKWLWRNWLFRYWCFICTLDFGRL